MRKARRHKPERETNELEDIQRARRHKPESRTSINRDNKWIGRLGDKWIGWWINLKRWPSSAQPLREPLMCMYIFLRVCVCIHMCIYIYIYMCVCVYTRHCKKCDFWEWCAIVIGFTTFFGGMGQNLLFSHLGNQHPSVSCTNWVSRVLPITLDQDGEAANVFRNGRESLDDIAQPCGG